MSERFFIAGATGTPGGNLFDCPPQAALKRSLMFVPIRRDAKSGQSNLKHGVHCPPLSRGSAPQWNRCSQPILQHTFLLYWGPPNLEPKRNAVLECRPQDTKVSIMGSLKWPMMQRDIGTATRLYLSLLFGCRCIAAKRLSRCEISDRANVIQRSTPLHHLPTSVY